VTAQARSGRRFLTAKASAILGVVSLLGLWIAGASSRQSPAHLAIPLAIAMVITATLGLVAAASPKPESIVWRLIGSVLSFAGLLVGVLLVMGLGV